MKRNILLGLCPIGKVLFSHKDAVRQKIGIQKKLVEMQVNYVDLDELLQDSDGLVREQSQVDKVVSYFKSKKIDALFVPHCNFGTEGAVGMIVKKLGVPTLLWGPRDEWPLDDGSRYRDSLCGMLASSKVIRKLVGNKFTYIENCRIDDKPFSDGMRLFLGAASVVKAFKNMKIGLLGARIDFFWSCIVNESELLQKFGIETIPFEIAPFIDRVNQRVRNEFHILHEELRQIKEDWLDAEGLNDLELVKGIAAAKELIELKNKYKLSAIAIQNFFSISSALGEGAAIYTMIASESFPISDESDIHGAISSVMLNSAKETTDPVFFPEYVIRHPEDDNIVCLWHVGAPFSIRHQSCEKVKIMKPWILPGDKPCQAQMRLKNGNLTVCRFDGDTGEYRLGIGEGEIVDGPYTRDYYGWLKVQNWARWERQLIEGPYIHHCSAAYGNYTDILKEACKYLDINIEIYGK